MKNNSNITFTKILKYYVCLAKHNLTIMTIN